MYTMRAKVAGGIWCDFWVHSQGICSLRLLFGGRMNFGYLCCIMEVHIYDTSQIFNLSRHHPLPMSCDLPFMKK